MKAEGGSYLNTSFSNRTPRAFPASLFSSSAPACTISKLYYIWSHPAARTRYALTRELVSVPHPTNTTMPNVRVPPLWGIIETALYVADLPTSAAFYRRLFGFETLTESDRLIALDVAGRSVLLLFQQGATTSAFQTPGGVLPGHGATGPIHFDFAITHHCGSIRHRDFRKRPYRITPNRPHSILLELMRRRLAGFERQLTTKRIRCWG